jgi:hypothetical protein
MGAMIPECKQDPAVSPSFDHPGPHEMIKQRIFVIEVRVPLGEHATLLSGAHPAA